MSAPSSMTYSFTSVSHQTCTYHRAFPSAKADLGCWTLSAKLGFRMIGILRLRKSLLAECQESAFRDVEPLVPFRTHASLYPIPAIAWPGTYLLPSQIRHCASYITFRPVPCVARWTPRQSWIYPYASHSRLAHSRFQRIETALSSGHFARPSRNVRCSCGACADKHPGSQH
jgi:hypothetical protein